MNAGGWSSRHRGCDVHFAKQNASDVERASVQQLSSLARQVIEP
jgi:hypothetical protein